MTTHDAVVIGGRGAVGTLLVGLMASDGLSVLAVDTSPSPRSAAGNERTGTVQVTHATGDLLDPDPSLADALRRAPIVVLAVPESVALAASWSTYRNDALVVETLSVKSSFASFAAQAPPGVQVLGINPMFAPSLGMNGRPVATVAHRPGENVERFRDRIVRWGGRVVAVEADRHDRLAAATQALTHAAVLAFGGALVSLDVDFDLVDALAPPPARTALALLARITGGEPEVYWDVQAGNPYAGHARRALVAAAEAVDACVDRGSEEQFATILANSGAALSDNADAYGHLCADLFGIVGSGRRSEDFA